MLFKSTLRLVIGDQKIHDSKQAGLDQFLHIRTRLFTGITFKCWEFRLSNTAITLAFARKFAEKLKAEKFIFQCDNKDHLKIALEFGAKNPGSKFMVGLGFCPATEQLRSLPPLEELQITSLARNPIGFSANYNGMTEIIGDILFEFLATHDNLYLDNVAISAQEWELVLQIMCESAYKKRMVQLGVTCATFAKWMKALSIGKSVKAGDTCGEFEVINSIPSNELLELRYRTCMIWVQRFNWTSGTTPVNVELTSYDPWGRKQLF